MGKTFALFTALSLAVSFQAANISSADAKGSKIYGFAVVAPDGTISRSKNVTDVTHQSAGVYKVNFNDETQKCAYAGTIAGDSHTLLPGYIVVSHDDSPSKTVIVSTFATVTLLPADYRFHLLVTC